jgi:hypothetical protein
MGKWTPSRFSKVFSVEASHLIHSIFVITTHQSTSIGYIKIRIVNHGRNKKGALCLMKRLVQGCCDAMYFIYFLSCQSNDLKVINIVCR